MCAELVAPTGVGVVHSGELMRELSCPCPQRFTVWLRVEEAMVSRWEVAHRRAAVRFDEEVWRWTAQNAPCRRSPRRPSWSCSRSISATPTPRPRSKRALDARAGESERALRERLEWIHDASQDPDVRRRARGLLDALDGEVGN
jgi:hypothetical protein